MIHHLNAIYITRNGRLWQKDTVISWVYKNTAFLLKELQAGAEGRFGESVEVSEVAC